MRGKKLANVVGDSFVDTSFLPGYADTPCVKRYLFRSHLWLGLMSEVAGAAQTGVKFTPAVQRAHDARVQATFSYAICPAAKIGR